MTLVSRLTAVVQAIAVDIKALIAAASAANYVLGQFPGSLITQVGVLRLYPKKEIVITKATVWISGIAETGIGVTVRKNNIILFTIIIPQGSVLATSATLNHSILTTDYLTVDIQALSGSDLVIRLDY